MDLEVREATAADAEGIRAVHLASIEGLAGAAYDDEQVAAWAHDRDPDGYPIGSPAAHLVVAEDGNRIVGFGWLETDTGDHPGVAAEGEIRAIYVHPSVARRGVGSRLYDVLEATARQSGLGSLSLLASRNAVAFYEEQGYRRVTERVVEFHDDVEGTVVEMRKELSDPVSN